MFVLIISRGFPSLQDVMIGNFEADQARALYALGGCRIEYRQTP